MKRKRNAEVRFGIVKTSWGSGCSYYNKQSRDLDQSKVSFFVEPLAKNNSKNNGDRQKLHKIFATNYSVCVIYL